MKTIFTFIVLCFSITLFSQFERGQWWLSGELDYTYNNDIRQENARIFQGEFIPYKDTVILYPSMIRNYRAEIGLLKVISPRWQFSLAANYGYRTIEQERLSFFVITPSTTLINQAIQQRYLGWAAAIQGTIPIQKKLYFATSLGVSYNYINSKTETLTRPYFGTEEDIIRSKSKGFNTSWGIFLRPKFIWFPTERLGLQLSVGEIGYTQNEYTGQIDSQPSHHFRARINPSRWAFGLLFKLKN